MLGLKINTFEPNSGAPDEASADVATAPAVTSEAPSTMAPAMRTECNRERYVRMRVSSTSDLCAAASAAPTQRPDRCLHHRITTSALSLRSLEDRPARSV